MYLFSSKFIAFVIKIGNPYEDVFPDVRSRDFLIKRWRCCEIFFRFCHGLALSPAGCSSVPSASARRRPALPGLNALGWVSSGAQAPR